MEQWMSTTCKDSSSFLRRQIVQNYVMTWLLNANNLTTLVVNAIQWVSMFNINICIPTAYGEAKNRLNIICIVHGHKKDSVNGAGPFFFAYCFKISIKMQLIINDKSRMLVTAYSTIWSFTLVGREAKGL